MGAENSAHRRPPLQHSASLDFNGRQQQEQQHRRKSTDMHFSDFSMFPDRYQNKKQQQQPGMMMAPAPPGVGGVGVGLGMARSVGAGAGGGLLSPGFMPGGGQQYSSRMRTHSEGDTGKAHQHGPYYFDYSCLPDKDPRCAQQAQVDEEKKRRVRMASQGEDEYPRSIGKNLSNATTPSPGKRGRIADYGFFDYSLIPDKMDSRRHKKSSD